MASFGCCLSVTALIMAFLSAALPLLMSEMAGGWTAIYKSGYDPVRDIPKLDGRYALVTGATTGIGRFTALHLGRAGATVFVHGRTAAKAASVVGEIRAAGGKAEVVTADLASLATVQTMAVDVASKLGAGKALDIAVLNAGLCKDCMGQTDEGFEMTKDGFELHIQVNHLSHQLLVEALLATQSLIKSSRVVSVSSGLEAMTFPEGIRYNYWREKGKEYKDGTAYSQSKLANIMMASELHRRYGVEAVSVHPGIIATDLGRYIEERGISMVMTVFREAIFKQAQMTTDQGSYTQLWAATTPGVKPGFYHPVGKTVTPHASFNDETSKECWDRSHEHLKKYLA
eukprot:TRINITY_DN75332_c0_g1_i1.p1 TRINITY_DN75332_c0_g1~~TRINITY_DN75332_c0_g1_i1.p1  ORF type:complete len:343 (+),score=66.33 TRINITY_DN75332_c0_g1_i1:110-1138(+)